jgi:hypothetical protein
MVIVTELNDEMEADRVAYQARKHIPISTPHGSHAHRIKMGKLEHEVYCVIEKPTRMKRQL